MVETLNHEGNAILLRDALNRIDGARVGTAAILDKEEPNPIDEALQSGTDHQRAIFSFMREHAGEDGLFSMKYREIAERTSVPGGSLSHTLGGLARKGLIMIARPGGAGESPIFQVANGKLINQGA